MSFADAQAQRIARLETELRHLRQWKTSAERVGNEQAEEIAHLKRMVEEANKYGLSWKQAAQEAVEERDRWFETAMRYRDHGAALTERSNEE